MPRSPGDELIRLLRAQGIADEGVLEAIRATPRARFIPPESRHLAGADRAVSIGLEQTISQPYMVARMTEELRLGGEERVLEVGTGSGYQAAILGRLAREVFTIERHRLLSLRARSINDGLGLTNISYRTGDGTLGWPETAPFDRILVTAAAPVLPETLFRQLAEGGLMVAPIGGADAQRLMIVRKHQGRPESIESIACRFVKLIGEQGWPEAPDR
jgi:protein-L-isoaspartate(D-aspartate) O-methyltransferase